MYLNSVHLFKVLSMQRPTLEVCMYTIYIYCLYAWKDKKRNINWLHTNYHMLLTKNQSQNRPSKLAGGFGKTPSQLLQLSSHLLPYVKPGWRTWKLSAPLRKEHLCVVQGMLKSWQQISEYYKHHWTSTIYWSCKHHGIQAYELPSTDKASWHHQPHLPFCQRTMASPQRRTWSETWFICILGFLCCILRIRFSQMMNLT